jgi:addiction module HigA family antidote
MKPKNRKSTHPGTFLRDVVLHEVGLSQAEVAERIHVSRNTISLLLNAKLRLSVEIAVKLGKLLNADAATLLKMQIAHDLWEVDHSGDDFAWIEPVPVMA